MKTIALLVFIVAFIHANKIHGQQTIDRKALVSRHSPFVTEPDSLSPFTVGNGEFAFTADITGLQTFPDYYKNGISLGTQSQWCWHSIPNPGGFSLRDAYKNYNTYGRMVPYASNQQAVAANWLRANPHRLQMCQIGFSIQKKDGPEINIHDVKEISQTLDLWSGILNSSFSAGDQKYDVKTTVHPDEDLLAVNVRNNSFMNGKTAIRFNFPYGSESWGKESGDWSHPEKHQSVISSKTLSSVVIERTIDSTKYYVRIQWEGSGEWSETGRNMFLLKITGGKNFGFTCHFSKTRISKSFTVSETLNNSAGHWQKFWKSGGAVDLSGSTDPRASELERRIVLSQYLTAIQCAGSMPPQETGLTFNSWYGKFHLEMHWWHAVHFALWGRPELFEKSLGWYRKILPTAEQTARIQGYSGARWPKMTDPEGRESPSGVGTLLIWQQPHPIYYAELLYRTKDDPAILKTFKDIVFKTAEFMASYAHQDPSGHFVLGPPLIPAQEIYKPDSTYNPPFELSYWAFGLKTALEWQKRLGLPENKKWKQVLDNLSPFPEKDGLYINAGNASATFENPWHRNDHPTVLGAFGMLPSDQADREKMRATLKKVMDSWNWQRTWGWDYPLVAMTAARVSEPEIAIDALMMKVQKNTYLNNGHNYQDPRLTIYLPGNGGLLSAIAMMAAGWEGAPDVHAPGFPKNGKWSVKVEGIHPFL